MTLHENLVYLKRSVCGGKAKFKRDSLDHCSSVHRYNLVQFCIEYLLLVPHEDVVLTEDYIMAIIH